MKIKFNWGFGIAATYIGFVIAVLIMVVIFMRQDVTLETKDYYAKGLVYQDQLEKMNRAKDLPEPLSVSVTPSSLKISFPKIFKQDELSGIITLYRPANDKSDFTIKITPDSARDQLIATNNIAKGLWKVRIDWSGKGVTFFNETPVMVN